MEKSDYQKFAQIMALLQEVFVPDKPISPMKVQVYFDVLKNHEIERVAFAADQIIKTKRFPVFPLPAEFKEVLGENREEEEISLRALQAWEYACSGYDGREGGKDDPLVDETIRIAFGGWQRFGLTDPEQETYDRKHFIDCFEILANREQMYKRDEIEIGILKKLAQTRKEIKKIEEAKDNDPL